MQTPFQKSVSAALEKQPHSSLKRIKIQEAESPFPIRLSDARPYLFPVLHSLPRLESAVLAAGGISLKDEHDVFGIFKLFSPYIGVGIAYDPGDLAINLSTAQLDQWDINPNEALSIAVDNLRKRAEPAFQKISPGTYVSQYGDRYDASRLLLPETVGQLKIIGLPVAMVPSMDCLLITGHSDPAGMDVINFDAEFTYQREQRNLSLEMFRQDGSEWCVWQPDEACAALHRRSSRTYLSAEYDSQKRALDGQAGNREFVANYMSVVDANNNHFSYATVTLGLPTLLPQAEFVAIVDLPAFKAGDYSKLFLVPWDVFCESAKNAQKLDYVLPRYRVTFSPTTRELAKLQQHEVRVTPPLRTPR
jgi:hypothetical protein